MSDTIYLVHSDEWGIVKSYEYLVDEDKTIETPHFHVGLGNSISGKFQILWTSPEKAPVSGTIQMYGKVPGVHSWTLLHSLEGVKVTKKKGVDLFFTARDLIWHESISIRD